MDRIFSPTLSCISIHAPARGSDGYTVIPTKRDHVISIHAPARGATYYKGGKTKYKKFQSTLPRGERRKLRMKNKNPQNFNPRSREGATGDIIDWNSLERISIHAPARGATSFWWEVKLMWKFQSTLPRGERPQIHTNN